MTQDTKQLFLFKDISGKKVVADFNGGDVSSDGGLLFASGHEDANDSQTNYDYFKDR